MTETALIRALARNLRYRELTHLIGKHLHVHFVYTIEDDIRAAFESDFPAESKLIHPATDYIERALTRYGLLDLTFETPKDLLNAEFESGVTLLERLGFMDNAEMVELAKELATDDDPTCLDELDRELQQGKTVIRLLLKAEERGGYHSGILIHPTPGVVDTDFVIEDAAVTNSGFVWFHKHFYL